MNSVIEDATNTVKTPSEVRQLPSNTQVQSKKIAYARCTVGSRVLRIGDIVSFIFEEHLV